VTHAWNAVSFQASHKRAAGGRIPGVPTS
jgi:hypothetical protein